MWRRDKVRTRLCSALKLKSRCSTRTRHRRVENVSARLLRTATPRAIWPFQRGSRHSVAPGIWDSPDDIVTSLVARSPCASLLLLVATGCVFAECAWRVSRMCRNETARGVEIAISDFAFKGCKGLAARCEWISSSRPSAARRFHATNRKLLPAGHSHCCLVTLQSGPFCLESHLDAPGTLLSSRAYEFDHEYSGGSLRKSRNAGASAIAVTRPSRPSKVRSSTVLRDGCLHIWRASRAAR